MEGRRSTLSAGAASSRPGGGSAIAIDKAAALEIQCKLEQHKKTVFDCSTVEIVGGSCLMAGDGKVSGEIVGGSCLMAGDGMVNGRDA